MNLVSLKPDEPVLPVKVPKGLLFPIRPRGPVVLPVTTLDGETYTLHIGGVSPLGGSPDQLCPAVCFRHLRLILTMLYGRAFNSPKIPLGFTDLLKHDGHTQRVLLRRTLNELGNTWMHRVQGDKVDSLRLLDYNPEIFYKPGLDLNDPAVREKESNIRYRQLTHVQFHDDFWRAFLNWSNCWNVRADVIERFQSDIAAACYMALTPKAYHPEISEDNKGRKDAAELLREIGATVPAENFEIKRIFERARGQQRSVLESLNGVATSQGYLCVDERLEKQSRGDGFNIRFWAIRDMPPPSAEFRQRVQAYGSLQEFWVHDLKMPEADFHTAQNPAWRELASYQIERIQSLGYPVEKNRRYLELIKAFIGPVRFDEVIGAAHMANNEDTIRDGIEKFLGGALRNAFRDFARRRKRQTQPSQ